MWYKNNKKTQSEVDLVSSISGRVRLRVKEEAKDPKKILDNLKEKTNLKRGRYCNINKTFVLEYEANAVNLNNLVLTFCGFYSLDLGIREVKLNYRLSRKDTLGYSSIVSLFAILLDTGVNILGITSSKKAYGNFIRWALIGTTIGAIFEHGYKELNENGAFDPEVMSIMYLINSVNKEQYQNTESYIFYPALIAWLLTFGRHILTRQNKSIIISTIVDENEVKVIEEGSKYVFFNQFINSCFDLYQNTSVKKSALLK